MVNTDTQPIITDEMGTVISVVSGRAYTVSVMAVVNDSQRSEPDRESVTAGGCSFVCSDFQILTFSAMARRRL